FSRAVKNRLRPSVLHFRLRKELCKRVAGSLGLTVLRKRQRFSIVWIRELWIRLDRFIEVVDSLACLPLFLESRSQTVQCPRILGLKLYGFPQEFLACIWIALLTNVEVRQNNPAPRVFWV